MTNQTPTRIHYRENSVEKHTFDVDVDKRLKEICDPEGDIRA
jgi:hypothetical protein